MEINAVSSMALQIVQQKLKAPKNQHNNFGNYDYRSCEDILEAVKPLLGSSTLTLSDEIVAVNDRVYVKATATFADENGNRTIVTAYAREALTKKGMDESQITGAASSYARKYALNGLFLIDDNKDADTRDNRQNASSDNDMREALSLSLEAAVNDGLIDKAKQAETMNASMKLSGKQLHDYVGKVDNKINGLRGNA